MNSSPFDIQPIGRWVGPSAAIKRPKEFAYFSYDDDHKFRLDDSSLRYYYPPRIGSDLCKGFDSFKKLDDTADDHLDSLLKTIAAHEQKIGAAVDADVITWRGMMTKLMAAPFSERDGFEMNATLFQGTIFLEENHDYKVNSQSKQRQQRPQPGRPSQDMMSFWGYKFETLCLIPNPWAETPREYIENRENEVVNNHAQYCSVVRTGIGSTTLILGGEVDAVWDSKPPPPTTTINWVELKTSVDPRSPNDMQAFERKLLKFWIQSFLLGVPKIIVGFRDQNGVLLRIEEIATEGIPRTVKQRGGPWDGNICVNAAASILEHLKQTITTEGVWRIRKRERSSLIEVFRMEEQGYGDVLSAEFVEWRMKLAAKVQGEDKEMEMRVADGNGKGS